MPELERVQTAYEAKSRFPPILIAFKRVILIFVRFCAALSCMNRLVKQSSQASKVAFHDPPFLLLTFCWLNMQKN